jgi:hypothetical protein
MPKQAAEQIEDWGVNFGRRHPTSGGHFSTPDHTWGSKAAELGWRPGELFDVSAGLIWRLAGQRVVYIRADRAHLRDGRVILRMETRGWH